MSKYLKYLLIFLILFLNYNFIQAACSNSQFNDFVASMTNQNPKTLAAASYPWLGENYAQKDINPEIVGAYAALQFGKNKNSFYGDIYQVFNEVKENLKWYSPCKSNWIAPSGMMIPLVICSSMDEIYSIFEPLYLTAQKKFTATALCYSPKNMNNPNYSVANGGLKTCVNNELSNIINPDLTKINLIVDPSIKSTIQNLSDDLIKAKTAFDSYKSCCYSSNFYGCVKSVKNQMSKQVSEIIKKYINKASGVTLLKIKS